MLGNIFSQWIATKEIHRYRSLTALEGTVDRTIHSWEKTRFHRARAPVPNYTNKTLQQAQHGDCLHQVAGKFIEFFYKLDSDLMTRDCRYKTQSLRSDSVTPSPTGYGSDTPEPSSQSPDRGVVWAVTDLASVPKGSLIIDPQTLQPILNQDGWVEHFVRKTLI